MILLYSVTLITLNQNLPKFENKKSGLFCLAPNVTIHNSTTVVKEGKFDN